MPVVFHAAVNGVIVQPFSLECMLDFGNLPLEGFKNGKSSWHAALWETGGSESKSAALNFRLSVGKARVAAGDLPSNSPRVERT